MRNFSTEGFYQENITIGGITALRPSSKTAEKNPDVQFFPEGGQLVTGVRSKVAIKAISANELGVDIEGHIEDNEGNIVADFSTQHLGMGVFAFTPEPGKTYRAKVIRPGETDFNVDLPKASNSGYTLTLNNSEKDTIYMKVAVNDQTLNEHRNEAFYVIAQKNGEIYYSSQEKLNGLVYTAKTAKVRFPTGITQFTLFSQNGEPLAERVAFIKNADTLRLRVNGTGMASATRQPEKINLSVTDSGKAALGSFSVAVINESIKGTEGNNETTILNDLLLTSELKGYVEQPNYYFINSDDKKRADLDLLMLTQGYRSFKWKKVLDSVASPIVFQPEKSLELAGAIQTEKGKPAANGKLTLLGAVENLIRDTTADDSGTFKFTGLNLTDTTKLVLKVSTQNKNSDLKIKIRQPDYPAISKIPTGDTVTNQSLFQTTAILQHQNELYSAQQKGDGFKGGIRLKQVTIKSNKPVKAPDLSRSASIHPGAADQVILGDKLGDCIDLADCLRGKAFGIYFKPNGSPLNTRVESTKGKAGVMSVIVDGNILHGSSINNINPKDIYSIEVLRSGAARSIYGSSIQVGGALVITMKHGGEFKSDLAARASPGLSTIQFIGYHKARAFYSPKYGVQNTSFQPTDLRNTVYWNPDVITDKNGKATFEYFNNDSKGTYRVVIEGIDNNGNLGRAIYRYTVN